jgi:hypothetical protein
MDILPVMFDADKDITFSHYFNPTIYFFPPPPTPIFCNMPCFYALLGLNYVVQMCLMQLSLLQFGYSTNACIIVYLDKNSSGNLYFVFTNTFSSLYVVDERI